MRSSSTRSADPVIQQPAASLGAAFEPLEKCGRVVFPAPSGRGQGFCLGVVQEPAAQLTDFFVPLLVGLEHRLAHAFGHSSGLAPLGPVDGPGQLRRLDDQLSFGVVARVELVDPFVDALVELDGVFLWQDRAHGFGVGAVLERIELGAGLAGLGFGPGAAF